MLGLARFSLLLVVVLVVVSAYLRLQTSGIGCPDWPACYGQIGSQQVESDSIAASAYQRIVEESNAPLAWAAPLHRLVASVLGLCVMILTFLSIRAHRHRLICLALLALTVFLAVIGLRSGSMHSTAIVMGNLAGGFAMMGLLGWLVFSHRPAGIVPASPALPGLVWIAIAVLILQILLGGFTSANFAALACTTLPDCHGSYWPEPALGNALSLDRTIEVSEHGIAVGGAERQAIHKAHRLVALGAFAAVLIAVLAAWRSTPMRATAVGVMLLLILEFGMGVTAVLTSLPIGLAVAHNWLAALLLLGLLRLVAMLR